MKGYKWRIVVPSASETKEAVKLLLSDRKKKAERVEMKKFDEIQFLEELKKRITMIDENLHCEVEIISGHPSSAVLCVFPSREKSFNDTIGRFQPVRYLFTPSGHYKFQVFIARPRGSYTLARFFSTSLLLVAVSLFGKFTVSVSISLSHGNPSTLDSFC